MRLYRLLSAVALAGYAPYALIRSISGRRKIGDLRGRLGRRPYPDLERGIWVHAVSVGEVGVARNLVTEFARREPGRRLGVSATTSAGLDLARRAVGPSVPVFSFPFDLRGPVSRALSGVRPGLVLLTETEIWPLFLHRAEAAGIPVALVNGRISARSFRGYRRLGKWFAAVLGRIALFAMQTEEDAERIRQLGADPSRVRIMGNVKYDLPAAPPFPDRERIRALAGGRPVLVAASTAGGEEDIVLSAWETLPEASRPLLAIAPRRPERFGNVAQLLHRRGHDVIRRSQPSQPSSGGAPSDRAKPPVYLLDSIGELSSLYGEARLAFVGGSFVSTGGHNPIEAWAAGVPVATGPHMESFKDVAEEGERLGILERVAAPSALGRRFAEAFADAGALSSRGERARRAVEENRGAAERTAGYVLPLLGAAAGRTAASR